MRKKTLLIIVFLLLFTAVAVLGYFAFFGKGGEPGPGIVIDRDIAENPGEYLDKADPENTQTNFKGFPDARIDSKTGMLMKNLSNPEGNAVFFQITIKIGETVLYESDYLPPGYYINTPLLSNVPGPGVYDAVFIYRCYHVETNQELNGANFQCKLTVE
ncbi:MAG: hypothetical protein LBL15_06820 [Oscillospiraceae bacterium]|jgi:hypothetical protein|nr:hypothetical protein [Oscillospiraceae bacterium]